MIKRTVTIENPSYLKIKDSQLVVEQEGLVKGKVPVEDIGVLVVDHPAVIYTHGVIISLLEYNAAVVVCGRNHHPSGLLLPLETHSVQSERFRMQLDASKPLLKKLWGQTVKSKIRNQARVLAENSHEPGRLNDLAKKVGSGDPANVEAQASRHYWQKIFGNNFRRERYGPFPNPMLNYGYMILRAAVARALVSSGLLPTLGIHHSNRYNAYCLADDVMEPYRPCVDRVVIRLHCEFPDAKELNQEIKAPLLKVLEQEIKVGDQSGPLMVRLSATTASLSRCFAGEQKTIDYPEL